MNKDELIDLVLLSQAIWDKRHKHHHNRIILAREWKKISSTLGVTDLQAKSAWRNLRQEFGRQSLKLKGKSGDSGPDEMESTWPYFNKLRFLSDQFTPRQSSGNIFAENEENVIEFPDTNTTLNASTDAEDDIQFSENSENLIVQPTHSPYSSSSPAAVYTKTGYKRRLSPQAAIGSQLLELEKEKLELAKRRKTESEDDDVAFFNSLLPNVKLLPRQEKMKFRIKVQQMLYEATYSEDKCYENSSGQSSDDLGGFKL